MLRLLRDIPSYVYIAGALGAAATYVLYNPESSKKKKRKNATLNGFPRGLINYKNECFINVILQSLAASNRVTEWFIRNKSKYSTIPSNLFDSLARVVAGVNRIQLDELVNMNDKNRSNKDEFDLDEFTTEFYAAQIIKRALNLHNWHIQSEEHDCHELFHLIMDVLDEEQLENKKSLTSLNYFQPSNLRETSRISAKNPFHGYLACQFQCLDCNYKYPLKLESFYSLSLTLPQIRKNPLFSNNILSGYSSNGTTLYECLNNFFKPELLTEMKCENCCNNNNNNNDTIKKRKGFIKRQAIAKLPDCLCIQIQRNSWSDQNYEMIKKTNFVQFPLSIKIDDSSLNTSSNLATNSCMNAFSLRQVGIGGLLGGKSRENSDVSVVNSRKNSSSVNNLVNSYELKSAVVHYGSAHSGHFVVYRKSLNNQKSEDWLQISDSDIKRVKQTSLLNSNVYMLFYDKVSSLVLN